MKKEYDFSKGRYFTPAELEENRKAIEAKLGKKRPPRPVTRTASARSRSS